MANINDNTGSKANEELIKELENLILAFSYEGRTPLSMIIGYATVLREGHLGNLPDEQLNAVRSMEMGARRVINLTNFVMDQMLILNLLHERTKLSIEQIDVQSWLTEVTSRFSKAAEEKEQQLIINAPQSFYGEFDPYQSARLLEYLINNALKYSEKGNQITISGTLQAGSILISVSDNGSGISEDDKPNIFSAWYRSSNKNTAKENGYGNELFIARRLAQALGSELGFESEEGKGSTFWFTLPLTKDETNDLPSKSAN